MKQFMMNLKLSQKLLLSSAVPIILLLAFGLVSERGLSTQKSAIIDMFNNRFKSYQTSSGVLGNVAEIHANLYRLLSWVNSKYEAQKIDALGKEQQAALARLAGVIQKEQDSPPRMNGEEQKLYRAIAVKLNDYRKDASDFIDLAQGDLTTATIFMATADGKYQELNKNLKALLALEDTLSAESYRQSLANHDAVVTILIAVLAVAVAITVIVSFVMSRIILTPVSKTISVIGDIASGDFTKRIAVDSSDEIGKMGGYFNDLVAKLHATISQVANSSGRLVSSATRLYETSGYLSHSSERIVAQTETVAAASEEMAATSNDIARNCGMAAAGARQASEAATIGASVVQKTVTGMENIAGRVKDSAQTVASLGTRSDQIGEIIGTIEDIADQTNLLALNAAIEAARAGEQGRGFAVVADEVRALAERTTRETKEIDAMIRGVQQGTRSAVSSMDEGVREVEAGSAEAAKSGEALADILEQVQAVAMQVNQIATAAEEQTATTGEITRNMHHITEAVQDAARGARETATAASELTGLADELQKLVCQFRLV